MYYTNDETRNIFMHHVKSISAAWKSDYFIMGFFNSGDPILIDLRDHKLANIDGRVGFCRATVQELQALVDFEREVPEAVRESMNSGEIVFDRFVEGHKLYVKLKLDPEEARKRKQKWEETYKKMYW